jgi:hypothetical protein
MENPYAPPNLVWDKDDLPSKSKLNRSKSISTDTNSQPPIPPVIIRPPPQAPIEPLRISNLPLNRAQHHIPTPYISDSGSSADEDEGTLKIAITPRRPNPPIPKLKMSQLAKKLKQHVGRKTPARPRKRPVKPKTPKSAPPTIVQPSQPIVPVPEPPRVAPLGSFPEVQFNSFLPSQVRVPVGWRAPQEGEKVYCYCKCAYDEVSQMIGCDGDDCKIEWFHFECVGILMAPKGKWYCPECKPKYSHLIEAEAAKAQDDDESQEEDPYASLGNSFMGGY